MKKIEVYKESSVINISADKLWDIVGKGFANLGDWSTLVDHSVGSGKPALDGASCETRVCDLNSKAFGNVSEKLDYYRDDEMTLSYYVQSGLPGFIKQARNHWKVVSKGENKSILKMTVTIGMSEILGFVMGGKVRKNFGKSIPLIFDDLKVFAETGKVSAQKVARMKKLKAA